ncbi:MAG: Hsp20/alpha crystallin family protein [Candidatus Helarchaeales archaeon]
MTRDEEERDEDKKRKTFEDFLAELQKFMEEMVSSLDPEELQEKFKEFGFMGNVPGLGTSDEPNPFVMGFSIGIGPDGKPFFNKIGKSEQVVEKDFSEAIREPLVDIMDQGDEFLIIIEVPGVEKDEISLKCTKTELRVKAGNKFFKNITLPQEVEPKKSKARLKNGILEVRVPKLNP